MFSGSQVLREHRTIFENIVKCKNVLLFENINYLVLLILRTKIIFTKKFSPSLFIWENINKNCIIALFRATCNESLVLELQPNLLIDHFYLHRPKISQNRSCYFSSLELNYPQIKEFTFPDQYRSHSLHFD